MQEGHHKKWLRNDPSGTGQWLTILEEIYSMEKLTYLLKFKTKTLDNRWDRWLQYKRKIKTLQSDRDPCEDILVDSTPTLTFHFHLSSYVLF